MTESAMTGREHGEKLLASVREMEAGKAARVTRLAVSLIAPRADRPAPEPHGLRQIDDAYPQSLEVEALRGLPIWLLADLRRLGTDYTKTGRTIRGRRAVGRRESARPVAGGRRTLTWKPAHDGERQPRAGASGEPGAIDTCRQRGHTPWRYLERAIADRRAGLPLAPLPQPGR